MKNELIEITIENIDIEKFCNQIKKTKLRTLKIHSPFLKEENNISKLATYFDNYDSVCCSLDIELLSLFGVELDNVILILDKLQNSFLTIVLNENTFNKIGVKELKKFISYFSKKIDGEKFYCGIEPSSDESTRFFTGNKLGPLEIK